MKTLKQDKKISILDSGTITGMVAYQLNLVLNDPRSSDKEKAAVIACTEALGYFIGKNEQGFYDVTKVCIPNMNWEAA
jgi:hypothetical protein